MATDLAQWRMTPCWQSELSERPERDRQFPPSSSPDLAPPLIQERLGVIRVIAVSQCGSIETMPLRQTEQFVRGQAVGERQSSEGGQDDLAAVLLSNHVAAPH